LPTRPSSTQALTALFVVGLGMSLIAALAGIVLWLVMSRKFPPPAQRPDLSLAEPAEA
jgi:hypothetical protein